MKSVLAAALVLCMPMALNGQTCGNGVKVTNSACCMCEKGFAPPDCTQCLPGYLLGTDSQGVQRCYDGVTDCHDLLPAPWGCGGKGRCVGCAPGADPCYPKCECNPGVTGDKCEGQATSQCLPESVHMYTVYPQQPVSDEEFNVQLWGCAIDGSSEYQIVPEETPCGVAVDGLCTIDVGDKLEIRFDSTQSTSDMECNTCGECTLPYAWEVVATDSQCGNGTASTTVTTTSLAECMGLCEKSTTCGAVNYACATGMCTHFSAPCDGNEVPGAEGTAMWKIKAFPMMRPDNLDTSKGCTVCNEDAAGASAECLATTHTEYWKATSLIAACEGQGGTALKTMRNTESLKACLSLCENVPECTAVDWFCQTKACILYNAPCASPGALHHGASSYELLSTQPSGSNQCSQCGECPDQITAGTAAAISPTAACEANDEGIMSYKAADATSFAACIDACKADAECKAIDWFCQVRQCKLYRESCTVPKATHHGASSFKMTSGTNARSASVLGGVTDAVSPGVTCASSSKKTGKCFDKLTTFEDAKNSCSAEGPGWRLCYKAELETGVCCNTGCGYNGNVVWMLDDYSKSSGRSCPAMGQTQKGCPSDKEKAAPTCEAVTHTKAVTCCSTAASMCYTTKGGNGECYGKYSTYQEAEKICSDDGKRLCTLAEVNDGLCCGRGCSINSKQVWTSNDGQQACTDNELAGVFANPAGMFDGCPQKSYTDGKNEHPEQCMEAKNTQGSVRCCYEPQPADETPMPTAAPNTCTGTAGQITGSAVKNSQQGCFVVSSRKEGSYWEVQGSALIAGSQQGAETVRLVAPFTMSEDSCSVNPRYTVQSHPNYPSPDPCTAGGACPICTAAVESCDKPGLYLKLDGGRITFEAAPVDACGVYNETGCGSMSACRWQTVGAGKKCVMLSLQEFGEKATFKVYLHKEYTNYTTFESIVGQNIVPDNGMVVGRDAVAASPDGSAWLMREIPGAKTSSEAVLPGLKVTGVPKGGAKYKVCQKKAGVWSALQTHTEEGYRTMTFDVVDLETAMRGAPAAGDEGCCNGFEIFDICIPWWAFLVLWLLLMACAGGLALKSNKQDTEAVRNNTKYNEFELDERVEEQGKARDSVDDDV